NSNGGTSWDNSDPSGTEWEAANDPSPAGWRVPTLAELQTLLDTDKVTNEWTTLNGVTGRKFTDKATGASIFLPAAGDRNYNNGTLYGAGTYGDYWSSPQVGSYYAYHLDFGGSNANTDYSGRGNGFCVRCVKAE
ncbi:MAG: fibrobacter succinogenes major paralogous domain-containing protein, partial [Prevotella sp.]|nr:fibrobacter succinogenes major paralogous domain-containing protein [Prevotella sp.]